MPEPRVLFCPFCGSGTLFIPKNDPTGWGCMKCERSFRVGIQISLSPALYSASMLGSQLPIPARFSSTSKPMLEGQAIVPERFRSISKPNLKLNSKI
jgi:hypothetical protein